MSTLLCNISTSESNLYRRQLMLSCAIIILLGFFDLMFSIFEGSRFNSCVNVDKVLWSNKNDSSLSRLASFKRLSFLGTKKDSDILLSLDFNESTSSVIDLEIWQLSLLLLYLFLSLLLLLLLGLLRLIITLVPLIESLVLSVILLSLFLLLQALLILESYYCHY